MTITVRELPAGMVEILFPGSAAVTVSAQDLLQFARGIVRRDATARALSGPVVPGGPTGAAVWFGHEIEDALSQERERVLGAPGPVIAQEIRNRNRDRDGLQAVQAAERALHGL